MTPRERKSLAEQIKANPLFSDLLDKMEQDSTEVLVFAKEQDMARAQLRVQVIRDFRSDLEAALQDTQARKGAPA